jgi:DUF2075 family protein
MKNIIFFITHKTLGVDHMVCSLQSLANQDNKSGKKFDIMYIYNTQPDELPNQIILNYCNYVGLDKHIKEIVIFSYDLETPKKLSSDIRTICDFAADNFEPDDRILLLKSDSMLSKNYFDDILSLGDGLVYFVAPWICAKARVTNDELFDYCKRDKYISSDDITFFVEDQTNSGNNDFKNRPGVSVLDEEIKFTSCYVIGDFSCHFMSVILTRAIIYDEGLTWGGVKFYNIMGYHVGTDRSFVVHKFHSIISENRSCDREGPVKMWLEN